MDIETLAVDTNESLEGDISSVLSDNNKLIPENLGAKGFLLDSSDVLLFQKELRTKVSSEDVGLSLEALLAKDKTLSSKDSLNIPLHAEDFQKILSKNDTVRSSNSTDFSISQPNEGLVDEKNISKKMTLENLPKQTSNLSGKQDVDLKTETNSEEFPKEISQFTKESGMNDSKSMPLESSIVIPNGTGVEIGKAQPSVATENAIRTHSEIISQQIKDQIIDRILVSANDLEQNKTVKIVLSPSLLENTEVNFQKIGQGLSIQFETMNTSSLQFLNKNQVDLQLYLQDNLKQFENVSVRVKGGSGNLEQPNDGRSRNRYEYENLDDEEQ